MSEFLARLGEYLPAEIARELGFEYRGCILATRTAIEVCSYFGVPAEPFPVRVLLYNEPYGRNVDRYRAQLLAGEEIQLGPEEHSVGIGFGKRDRSQPGWDGHLILISDGAFADYSIQQAERTHRGIHTGPWIVGPYHGGDCWTASHRGTTLEYQETDNFRYRMAPDWHDPSRIRRVAGRLIRQMRAEP
jgi:hypothetical protein